MNKKLIKNRAYFSLGLDIFFENNKNTYNNLLFIEYLSLFLSLLTPFLIVYFFIAVPVLFIPSLLVIAHMFINADNCSLYSNLRYINFLHPIFNPLIELMIKNKLLLNTNRNYFYKIRNNEEVYFYNISNLKPEEYNDALYYWYWIQKKTNSLEEKEKALLNINFINSKIKEYNQRVKVLDINIEKANKILEENNIDIDIDKVNESKIKKITVLNI